MPHSFRPSRSFCDEPVVDCDFERRSLSAEVTVHYRTEANCLLFCRMGCARITSTLFQNKMLYAGEVRFIPRGCEYCIMVGDEAKLLVHHFNHMTCIPGECALSRLFFPYRFQSKKYCCKLDIRPSLLTLVDGIFSYIEDAKHDFLLWYLKHRELVWVFTRYYSIDELCSFFQPIEEEQSSFKKLVFTHYHKTKFTGELAGMCDYGVHNFRKVFRKEFSVPPYRWMILKRAEHVRFRLTMSRVPFADIIEEFNFSSPAHFTTFCKRYLGDTPSNLRKSVLEK